MLVLSRRESEAVLVTINGVQCRVSVKKIGTAVVRLAFEGPDSVQVWREEIAIAIRDTPPKAGES
jgi:carbon storage regulator CsrA